MSISQTFPATSRGQWLTKLERKAKSDAAIRKQIADYANLKVGITESTKQLLSPVTKATEEASQKQLELQTKLGDEASESARKQFLATNSAAVDQALYNEKLTEGNEKILSAIQEVNKLEGLVDIQKEYLSELQKQLGDQLGLLHNSGQTSIDLMKELLNEQGKTLKEIKQSKSFSKKNFDKLSEDISKFKKEANKVIPKKQKKDVTTITDIQEDVLKETKNKFDVLKDEVTGDEDITEQVATNVVRSDGSTVTDTTTDTKPKNPQVPYSVKKPNDKIDQVPQNNYTTVDYYRKLKDASDTVYENISRYNTSIQKKDKNYHFNYPHSGGTEDPSKIVEDLEEIEKVYKTKVGTPRRSRMLTEAIKVIQEWQAYRNSIEGEQEDPYRRYNEFLNSELDKANGEGLKTSPTINKDLDRVQVLLASNQAGNDSGLQEFTKILKKLLNKKAISKTDYDRFVKNWRK